MKKPVTFANLQRSIEDLLSVKVYDPTEPHGQTKYIAASQFLQVSTLPSYLAGRDALQELPKASESTFDRMKLEIEQAGYDLGAIPNDVLKTVLTIPEDVKIQALYRASFEEGLTA